MCRNLDAGRYQDEVLRQSLMNLSCAVVRQHQQGPFAVQPWARQQVCAREWAHRQLCAAQGEQMGPCAPEDAVGAGL